MAPRLPPETLSHIFRFYASDTLSYPLSYPAHKGNRFLPPQICSSWRKAALGTSELWTDIEIHRKDLVQDVDFDSLGEWLQRSKDRTLKVALLLGPDERTRRWVQKHASTARATMDVVLMRILSQVRRWREATMVCPAYVLAQTLRLVHRAQSLRAFSMAVCEDDEEARVANGHEDWMDDIGKPMSFGAGFGRRRIISLSNLTSFFLKIHTITHLAPLQLPTLKNLSLVDVESSTQDLHRVLSSWELPQLIGLTFQNYKGVHEANLETLNETQHFRYAHLPMLRALTLSGPKCLASCFGATLLKANAGISHLGVDMGDPDLSSTSGIREMERLFQYASSVKVVDLVFAAQHNNYDFPPHESSIWSAQNTQRILKHFSSAVVLKLRMGECEEEACQPVEYEDEPCLFDFICLLSEYNQDTQQFNCPALRSLLLGGIPCEDDELVRLLEVRNNDSSGFKVTLESCPGLPDVQEADLDALRTHFHNMTDLNLPFLLRHFSSRKDEFWDL
jgi:hypothetical protein